MQTCQALTWRPALEDAIKDADALLLLVKHTEFVNFNPEEIAGKTKARIVVDTVNGWNAEAWKNAGFTVIPSG